MADDADPMPAGSVTVVNPGSWVARAGQLAPLLTAAAGRPEGARVVPDTTGAPPSSTLVVADPSYWSAHGTELGEALGMAASEEPSGGRGSSGPVSGAAPATHERLTLTVEEAATVLGISRAFAYDAVRRGDIPAIKIGRRILVPKAALDRLLEVGGPEEPGQ